MLSRDIGLQAVLQAFSGVHWQRLPRNGWVSLTEFEKGKNNLKSQPVSPGRAPVVRSSSPKAAGLSFRPIVLPGKPPPFAKKSTRAGAHSIAFQFLDAATGGRLLVAPDVAEITEPLRRAMEESDAIIFDGTFWLADELARVKRGAVTAQKMGHVPVRGGSLEVLAKLPAWRRIYIHINNTNPILACASPERSQVEAAGILIGHDGYAFEV